MNTPTLLLLFNRPNLTSQLIKRLREIRPKKIYVNIDGTRKNFDRDKLLCKEVLNEVKKIDWKCKLIIKKSKLNKGCRKSVKQSIDFFFTKEKSGIILEDDCIPSKFFFIFCNKLLNKFSNFKNLKCISGSNFQKKKIGNGDYYFSKYAHCWGWATWRRAWKDYDNEMKFWEKLKNSDKWKKIHNYNNLEIKYWNMKFDLVKNKKIDSWAYVWLASIWNANGIALNANGNLVKNIGFDSDATHTSGFKYNNVFRKLKIGKKLKHPKSYKVNNYADSYVFRHHYNGIFNFWPWRFIYLSKFLINNPVLFFKKVSKKIFFKF